MMGTVEPQRGGIGPSLLCRRSAALPLPLCQAIDITPRCGWAADWNRWGNWPLAAETMLFAMRKTLSAVHLLISAVAGKLSAIRLKVSIVAESSNWTVDSFPAIAETVSATAKTVSASADKLLRRRNSFPASPDKLLCRRKTFLASPDKLLRRHKTFLATAKTVSVVAEDDFPKQNRSFRLPTSYRAVANPAGAIR